MKVFFLFQVKQQVLIIPKNLIYKMSKKEIKERMKKQLEDDAYLTEISKKPFEQADKNKNGEIDVKELKACMIDIAQGMGTEIPKNKVVVEEFYNLDKDKSKTIDFNEFKTFIKNNMIKIIDSIPED